MWNCYSARIINPWLTLCVDHHGTPSSLLRILIDKPILIKIKESECADGLAGDHNQLFQANKNIFWTHRLRLINKCYMATCGLVFEILYFIVTRVVLKNKD
jgi:hypothetical protein